MLRLGMECVAALVRLDFFRNGIDDEAVRRSSGIFRRPGDTRFQFVRQTDCGRGHGNLGRLDGRLTAAHL
nr:hypothetical protein [Xanthomonas oryzae]